MRQQRRIGHCAASIAAEAGPAVGHADGSYDATIAQLTHSQLTAAAINAGGYSGKTAYSLNGIICYYSFKHCSDAAEYNAIGQQQTALSQYDRLNPTGSQQYQQLSRLSGYSFEKA
jgi:hypothetical protein